MKREIELSLLWIANCVSGAAHYENWSDELFREYVKKGYENAINLINKYVDIKTLSRKEAFGLGFEPWYNDIMLIPLYLLPIIPIGMELISIDGETIIYDGSNVDIDTRHGCIAYGIRIPEKKDD